VVGVRGAVADDGADLVRGPLVVGVPRYRVAYATIRVSDRARVRVSALLVDHRGPESFWLMRNRYNRDESGANYEYYDREPREPYGDARYMKWTLIAIGFSAYACE